MHLIGWISFVVLIFIMLGLDLFVFHKKSHAVSMKEATLWSLFWIFLALGFNAYVWFSMGQEAGIQFLTGYLVEKSLSVDNLFVFVLIFSYFHTPEESMHKVLFWGVLGAIITRGIFIFLGLAIIQVFHPIIYLFGIFLLVTGFKLFFEKEKKFNPEKNLILKLFYRFFPLTKEYEADRFFVKRNKTLFATPLAIVLVVIETTDIIFAVDSIPAIFAITLDPFIVFTSNIFAVLGLRSLFFLLAGSLKLFRYLHYGIALILMFVGFKMLIEGFIKIPSMWALGVVFLILLFSILASLFFPQKKNGT